MREEGNRVNRSHTTRFRRQWHCDSCGAPLQNGERLNCDSCEAMLWSARDQALARQIARHDKFVPPANQELPTRRVRLLQIAAQLDRLTVPAPIADPGASHRVAESRVGNLAGRATPNRRDATGDSSVRVAALDPDIVEAVVQRIDELCVPETPEGAKLIPITRGLWREEWPR